MQELFELRTAMHQHRSRLLRSARLLFKVNVTPIEIPNHDSSAANELFRAAE